MDFTRFHDILEDIQIMKIYNDQKLKILINLLTQALLLEQTSKYI